MDFNEYPNNGNHQNNQQPPSLLDDEKLMAVLAWVLNFVAALIAPLIIMLINGNKSKFIEHHAKQSLNVMLSSVVYTFVGIIFAVLGAIVLFLLPLTFLVFGAIMIYSIVMIIKGAIHASRLEPFNPPLTIPFFR